MLQECNTVSDTQDVINSAITNLFPQSSGKLAYYNKQTNTFQTNLTWGNEDACFGQEFKLQECTALKNKKMLMCDQRYRDAMCSKMQRRSRKGTVCNPLVVGDKTVGLMHLQYTLDRVEANIPEDSNKNNSMQRALIRTASGQISQAVANLHLREELQSQAILDSLTGLYNRRYIDFSLKQEISRAQRKNSTVAMIMLDVDHFK